jgi:SAM-dependent methyltransferase
MLLESNPIEGMVSPDIKLGNRNVLASRFLAGEGIEIGAASCPLSMPEAAKTTYVDIMDEHVMREKFSYLGPDDYIQPVDVIDNGELLEKFDDASLDYIVANHFLEHCENPIGTIDSHMNKLKPGGVAYYALPDKRYTFDKERPLTTLEHFIADFKEGPAARNIEHYREWGKFVANINEDDIETFAREQNAAGVNIHFHVWDARSFVPFLSVAQDLCTQRWNVEEFLPENENEFIVVLRRHR